MEHSEKFRNTFYYSPGRRGKNIEAREPILEAILAASASGRM